MDAAELEFVSMLIDRRVDHVVVGAGPTTVRIGPMTIDGGGPCVRCDELLRIDMDPSWKQLSVQLSLDEAPEQSPTLLALAAAEVAPLRGERGPSWRAAAFNAVLKTGYRGGAWRRRLRATSNVHAGGRNSWWSGSYCFFPRIRVTVVLHTGHSRPWPYDGRWSHGLLR